MARVITGTGDEGYTDLLGRGRVPKYHRRPEAYGTIDEATSSIGLARALGGPGELNDRLRRIQQDLYTLMAELATAPETYDRVPFKVRTEDVTRLEEWSREYQQKVEIGNKFIIPGANAPGAALDVARTVVRRGERLVARMYHEGDASNLEVLRYLNRLSDLLFIMARYVEKDEAT